MKNKVAALDAEEVNQMEQLVFKAPRKTVRKRKTPVIRISPEAYSLIEDVSAKTGLSNSYIASKMIEFAAANTAIEYPEEQEE